MSEEKFTKGRWQLAPTGEVMHGYSQPMAIASEFERGKMTLIAGLFSDVQGGIEAMNHNGVLIASAPILYSALEEALMPLELYRAYGWADRGRVIPRVKAALKAARGEA